MKITKVEKTIVEEDVGLLTPGAIVSVEYEPGDVLDLYCGICIAHINNNVFVCMNRYTNNVYCKGSLGECRKKFDELVEKIINKGDNSI